jgi:tetratricopeptide (TPR) repeat protein
MRRIKPKTVRRLLLLGMVAVLGAGSLFTLVWVRGWQNSRRLERERVEGIAAFERSDYPEAMLHLSRYLNRNRDDMKALAAYAESREHVWENDGRNLREAMKIYEQVRASDPSDRRIAMALLRLYVTLGQFPEARDLARRMRPEAIASAGAEHAEVLELEAAALIGLSARGERLDGVVDRLIALKRFPMDLFVRDVMDAARTGQPGQVDALVARIAAGFPGDPRVDLLRLAADQAKGSPDTATFAALCRLAGLDERTAQPSGPAELPDTSYALLLAGMFDSLLRPEHAFAVLREADAKLRDPGIAARYVRRCWQRGLPGEVVARVGDGPYPTDFRADLLAFKALSLLDLGRGAEADAVIESLASIRGDFAADAWADALQAVRGRERAGEQATLRALRAAQKKHPAEPVITFLVGDALARLSRFDEARETWLAVTRSPLALGWTAPVLRASESLSLEGRSGEAADAASAAMTLGSRDPAAVLAWVEAETSATLTGLRTPTEANSLLERLNGLLSGRTAAGEAERDGFDRLEVSRLAVLSRLGRRDEALAGAVRLIDRDPPSSLATLERLAFLSNRESWGLASRCSARAAASFGSPTPALGFAEAAELAAADRPDDGLARLRTLAEGAQAESRCDWDLAAARFLEASRSEAAVAEWKTLVRKYEGRTDVLRAALSAPSLANDPEFVESLAAKFAQAAGTGVENAPAFVQLARARALLSGAPSKRRHDEAVGLLNKLTATAPQLLGARELLIDALSRDVPSAGITADPSAAMSQIESAAGLSPDPSGFLLRGARLMQDARDFERARALVARVLSTPGASASTRAAAAEVLVAQGEFSAAVGPLEAAVRAGGETPDTSAMLALARAYAALRRDDEALRVYRRLADSPLSDMGQIVDVAGALAAGGDPQAAGRLLERLPALGLSPAQLAMAQGRYSMLRGDRAAAAAKFEEATRLDSRNPETWRQLVSFRIDNSEPTEAAAALGRALAAVPDDPQLRILEQRVLIAAGGGDQADLGKLAEALALDPTRTRAAEAVRAVEEARRQGLLDDPAAVIALADRFKDVLAVQGYAARRLLMLPTADRHKAVELASNAMEHFPSTPESARLAVDVYAEIGAWEDMLRAALTWRQRDPSRPPEADLAVADARLRLGQAAQAADELAPRLAESRENPNTPTHLLILKTYARAMTTQRKNDEAVQLLAPMLASPRIRNEVWLPLAATEVTPSDDAAFWIGKASAATPANDPAGHLAIARAYFTLALRFSEEQQRFLGEAERALGPATSRGASAEELELLGIVLRRGGDTERAGQALSEAIRLDPSRHAAVQSLVEMLCETGREAEAVATADRVLSAVGDANVDAMLNVARAHVLAARGSGEGSEHLGRALALYRRAADSGPPRLDVLLEGAETAERLGEYRVSSGFYGHALTMPLASAELAANIRNNAAFNLFLLNPTRDELVRARALALEAVQLAPRASHYDTLAHIEAALGSRDPAIRAYRDALRLDPRSVSARLGLAQTLAAGTSNEKTEARTIVDQLAGEADAGSNPKISETQRQELKSLRTRLAR